MSMQRHRYATAQSHAAYLRQWGKGLLEIIQLEPLIV